MLGLVLHNGVHAVAWLWVMCFGLCGIWEGEVLLAHIIVGNRECENDCCDNIKLQQLRKNTSYRVFWKTEGIGLSESAGLSIQ